MKYKLATLTLFLALNGCGDSVQPDIDYGLSNPYHGRGGCSTPADTTLQQGPDIHYKCKTADQDRSATLDDKLRQNEHQLDL